MVKSAKENNVAFSLFHDCYVVPPGRVTTNDGRPYSVFSPWNRKWTDVIAKDMSLIEASPDPDSNDKSIHKDKTLGSLFNLDKLGEGFGVPKNSKGLNAKIANIWPNSGLFPTTLPVRSWTTL